MSAPPRLPQASLALLALVHAAVTGAAARFLPWPSFSVFAGIALVTSLSHLAVALLAAVGSRRLLPVWRASSFVSLGFLAYVTYAAGSSGLYVARLYLGVGVPLAAAAGAAWCVVAFFTLPIACWGIATTGGLFRRNEKALAKSPRDAGPLALTLLLVSGALGMATNAASSRAEPVLAPEASRPEAMARALAQSLAKLPKGRAADASLFVGAPTKCAEPPSPGRATVFATYLQQNHAAISICVQRPLLDEALDLLAEKLGSSWGGGPILIDVATGVQPLPDSGALLGAVLLRPGSDGACLDSACLVPWQLVADDQFTRLAGFAALQLKVGLSAPLLRQALGGPAAPAMPAEDVLAQSHAGFRGITRLETQSFVRKATGEIQRLDRMLGASPAITRDSMLAATKGALAFAAQAQEDDGRFRYLVDPFTGETSYAGFALPRQAGMTLALCDAGALEPKSGTVALRSLTMLASLEQHATDKGAIVYPKDAKTSALLGSTALSMIAFLACRDRVGHQFDPLIGRLGRGLLASQRPDGGFFPAFDPSTDKPVPGKDILYAEGQAVMALVLWEGAKGADKPDGVGAAIDRAMDYFAGPYWASPIHDFFYLEENWHCLAARAAIVTGHRRDAYERYCIDYMTMKSRLVMDETSGVDPEFVGAYGFGDVLPPHHAATAGFAEALAAMMAVKHARGETTVDEERVLRMSLAYMLKNQWRDDNCFLCTRRLRIPGGFSENIGSPAIRIDFVQHALAALSHGGRELGLLRADEVEGPM